MLFLIPDFIGFGLIRKMPLEVIMEKKCHWNHNLRKMIALVRESRTIEFGFELEFELDFELDFELNFELGFELEFELKLTIKINPPPPKKK